MYTIYKNTIRRVDRLHPAQLENSKGRYGSAEEAENALIELLEIAGKPKAIRALRERVEFKKWLDERDSLVDAIIAECNRLERDIPAAAYALGSTDLGELSEILENLKSK